MTDNMNRFRAEKLIAFSAKALEKLGVPHDHALITAEMLVTSDLRGVESHGVAHLRSFYARRIRAGLINLNPQPEIFSSAPSTATMDGDGGLGFVIGHKAMNEAIRRAKETGAGFVSVRNSTHAGCLACYAMMALDHDMAGFAMVNSVGIVVAPGTSVPVLGTNPLAFAAPAGEKAAFVLDMATSVTAFGKIEIAARTDNRMPPGWTIDGKGEPVTDVSLRKWGDGGLLPLGGSPELGSYKGFGLGMMVEILCGILSGSGSELLKERKPAELGNASDHFFGALRIDSFTSIELFKQQMDALLYKIESMPKLPGWESITIPGLYEAPIVKDRQENGIPLEPKVVEGLQTLANELGIEFDIQD